MKKLVLVGVISLGFLIQGFAVAKVVFKIDIGEFSEEVEKSKLVGFDYVVKQVNATFSYHVGDYSDFLYAQIDRNKLVKRGFEHTEVIAFFNNIEISLSDAFTMIDDKNEVDATEYIASVDKEIAIANQPKATNRNIAIEEFNSILDNIYKEEVIFTIQLGVFSSPKKDSDFDVEGIIVERKKEGKYSYSYGEYTTVETAKEAVKIVQKTIKGVYVVAYKDERRITLGEATTPKR